MYVHLRQLLGEVYAHLEKLLFAMYIHPRQLSPQVEVCMSVQTREESLAFLLFSSFILSSS